MVVARVRCRKCKNDKRIGESLGEIAIGKRIGLTYEVTPRSMRRTCQALARAAELKDVVTHSISGHATPEMQRHYSTVSGDEMRAGLAKIIDIATARRAA